MWDAVASDETAGSAPGGTDGVTPGPTAAAWRARLALRFETRGERSILARSQHEGPLRVQRPFYPAGKDGPCHVYLLHPPGGIVSDDHLRTTVDVQAGAQALVTTPGAGKLYRTRGLRAFVDQRATIADGAHYDHLPQETIAFADTDAELRTLIDVAEGGSCIGWDILCLGRPAAGETFDRGRVVQRIELQRAGRLRWFERAELRGGSPLLAEPWGLGGHTAFATMWCSPGTPDALAAARAAVEGASHPVAFTIVRDIVIGRALGDTTAALRDTLGHAWLAMRAALGHTGGVIPRIWHT